MDLVSRTLIADTLLFLLIEVVRSGHPYVEYSRTAVSISFQETTLSAVISIVHSFTWLGRIPTYDTCVGKRTEGAVIADTDNVLGIHVGIAGGTSAVTF